MQLYSLQFIVFLVVLLALYYGVGKLFKRGQWIVLLVAGLAFYCMVGTWKTLVLVAATAFITWSASLYFSMQNKRCKAVIADISDRAEKKAVKAVYARKKRIVFWVAIILGFGILAWLKYVNVVLASLGIDAPLTSMGLLLPLGISFYTFQSMGYLIDTYNGKYEPQANFAKHALFVTYFPQMIQGPINRYDDLGPQLFELHTPPSAQDTGRALLQFGYGLFKKVAIADLLVGTIDLIFANVTDSIPGSAALFGILLYSAYQYADFSGGIDMVEGTSELLGIKMARNFKRPYFSVSLADFWRRWHITLGAWMRDYVFYPFALAKPVQRMSKFLTSRIGKHLGRTIPACLANILVFFLVGLWHGAEAHYIAWGLYNGIVIALADLCAPLFTRIIDALHINQKSAGYHVFRVIRTFIVVNIGWYFDRIYSFSDCLICLRNTIFNFAPDQLLPFLQASGIWWTDYINVALAVFACIVLFCVSFAQERGVDVMTRILALNPVARFAIYVFFGLIIMVAFTLVAGKGVGGFMYANF